MEGLLTPPEFDDSFEPYEFTYDPTDTGSVGSTPPAIPELTQEELARIVIIGDTAARSCCAL